MMSQKNLCDDHHLQEMLRGESNGVEVGEMLDHVETCARCQHRLDELAANESEWQKAVEVLSSNASEETSEGRVGMHASLRLSHLDGRPVAWTESMARQLLSSPSHPEMLGRIGRYDVERLIGSGGMGVVFKAWDTELNRPVAIKLLAPYLASSGAARKRFAREARAAAAVVDEHVVAIHNVESDRESPFLVMKYIAGGSLQQRLDREGPLEVCEVLRIGMHTAKGLAAAHAQGLIHRDVKPSNILLDEGVDRALLTDFGLARATDDASLTRSGFHPGTPHYMSPEQVRGEAIDARSDLFGLGCVMYALCTGHPPFRSETSYAVLRRITDDTPRPIRETNPGIPPWLEQIVMKLLAKSANDRFDSAAQVAELLEGFLAHVQQPATIPLPESVAASAPKQHRRPPIGKFIGAAAFAFSLIFFGVLIVLETNKGTLTIECEADDVPIRIMQGEVTVKQLTISMRGATTRLQAGNYTVEVDGDSTAYEIKGNRVTLRRGENPIVRIGFAEANTASASNEKDPEPGVLQLKGSRADVRAAQEALSQLNASEPGRTEKSEASVADEVGRLLSEIKFLNEHEERGASSRRSVKYGADVKHLASFGSEALPGIIEELDRTDDARMIATLAFVLRAIGDKRGVPALIRAIPRAHVWRDDCNWIQSTNIIDKELTAFFREHKFAGQGDAAIGCSNATTELSMTLTSLTGATIPFTSNFGRGTPLQIYLQKKLLHKDVERWGTWWEQHSSSMVDDVTYSKAGVPEFQMKSPGSVAPNQTLAKVAWEITYDLKSLRGVTAGNKTYPFEFLDLDTGRSSRVPEQWRDKQLSEADLANLYAWAENEGFDLTCDQYQREGGDSQYVLRGIGLKAWQVDEKSWKDDVPSTWGELAKAGRIVADDWLIPFVKESGVLDPKGMAPFLVVTREGSPVLIYVGAEITDDSAPDEGFHTFDSLDDHVGLAKGRRLGIQLFETAQSETAPGADDSPMARVQEAQDVAVTVPSFEFETLEDFLKPGKTEFDSKMRQIDERLLAVTKGSTEHKLLMIRKTQLQVEWDANVAQVKGLFAAAKAGNPVSLPPIIIPNNSRPWQAPLPDPLMGHDEDIAKLLAGTWDVKRIVQDGEEHPLEGSTVTFSRNMMIMQLKWGGKEAEIQFMYRIGNDKIDIWDCEPGSDLRDAHPMLGSFLIENDTLRICHHETEMEFETPQSRPPVQPGKGFAYWELQRRGDDKAQGPDQPPLSKTIEPVKPNTPNATANDHEAAIVAGNMASRKTQEPTAGDAAHTISGFVMEFRSGTPDVPVCLCDAATGMPVAKETYKPIDWSKGPAGNPANEMAIVVSDAKGNFRFDNVPDGRYRLIAQKWMGPYKGVFELHGAEIRLLGAIDEIPVPRPADEQEARVVPTPLGENTIQFNQDVGNNETFLFLSTAPPEFDPILGLQGLGTSFWKNLIGVNRMPLGKTTVIGTPNKPVYAFMFAPDNSPGYAAITIPPPESGLVRLPAEPFVAGWSDGRKTPPPKLAELIEFMKKHDLKVQQLLDIPEMSNANFKAWQARMQELTQDLARTIELPEGQSARIGDLMAADAYRKLQK